MKTVDGSINSGSRGSSRGSSGRVGGGVDLAAFELPAWRTSCKLAWLVEHLQNLREEDPSVKVVVFSQWTCMLDLVQWVLAGHGRNNQEEEVVVDNDDGNDGRGGGGSGGNDAKDCKGSEDGGSDEVGDSTILGNKGGSGDIAGTPVSVQVVESQSQNSKTANHLNEAPTVLCKNTETVNRQHPATATKAKTAAGIAIPFVRLDGSMSREQRDKALRRFRDSKPGGQTSRRRQRFRDASGDGKVALPAPSSSSSSCSSSSCSGLFSEGGEGGDACTAEVGEEVSPGSSTTSSAKSRKISNSNSNSNNNEPFVLLASLKACGVGLNLTCASVIVLVDLWWNPAVENQAIDRVHRFGQTKPVRVWRLTVGGTVEDKLLLLQERKRQLACAALEEEGNDDEDDDMGQGDIDGAEHALDAGGGICSNNTGSTSADGVPKAGGVEKQPQQRLTAEELKDFFR